MNCVVSTVKPLTDEQRAFADKNAQLIHGYLCSHPAPKISGMEYDDWYMVVTEGYMNAVHYWFSKDELRDKYQFSTVAFMAIKSAVRRILYLCNAQCRKSPGEVVSLDVSFSWAGEEARDELSLYNYLASTTDIVAEFEFAEETEQLSEALSMLTEQQQEVIRLRFFEGVTLKTAGQAVGITLERVRQIEIKALNRLKNILKGMEHMPRGEKTPDAAIKAVESMAHEGKSIGKISIKTGLAQSTVTNIIARMRKSEMTVNQDFEAAVQKMESAIPKAKEPAPAATDTSSQTKLPTVSIPPEPEKVKHYFSQAILEAAENAITLQADELCRISAQQARYQEQIDALREKITALDDLYTYEAAELDRLQSDYTFMVGGLEHE